MVRRMSIAVLTLLILLATATGYNTTVSIIENSTVHSYGLNTTIDQLPGRLSVNNITLEIFYDLDSKVTLIEIIAPDFLITNEQNISSFEISGIEYKYSGITDIFDAIRNNVLLEFRISSDSVINITTKLRLNHSVGFEKAVSHQYIPKNRDYSEIKSWLKVHGLNRTYNSENAMQVVAEIFNMKRPLVTAVIESENTSFEIIMNRRERVYESDFFNLFDAGNYKINVTAVENNQTISDISLFNVTKPRGRSRRVREDVLETIYPARGQEFDISESVRVIANIIHKQNREASVEIRWRNNSIVYQMFDPDRNKVYETDFFIAIETGLYNVTVFYGNKSVKTWFEVVEEITEEKTIEITEPILITYEGETKFKNVELEIPEKYEASLVSGTITTSDITIPSMRIQNITSTIKEIEFHDITHNGSIELGVEDLSLSGYVQSFAIDPEGVNFTNATVTVTAKGQALFKCKDWNFSQQSCYGEWELFKSGLVPGQAYTFLLTPDDPGFGEIIVNNESEFNNGTYFQTFYNASQECVQLNATYSAGWYASEIFDANTSFTWSNISWTSNAIGELPGNRQVETKFAAGNANMTQNVLLLHLNNDSMYGENSTYVYDFSGQGNNGTPIADAHPNSTNYKFGSGAFDFDGTGDYIKINDSPSLDINGSEFTFEAWIKPSGSPSNEDNFFIKGDRNDVINYYLSRKSSGSMTWAFKDPAWNYLDSTSDQPATGEWSYIALVFKRPNVTFYVNDNSWHYNNQATGGSMDKDLPSNNYDLWIGSGRNNGVPPSPGSSSAPFDGTMDEVAIYNRSLSPDEILEHYERGVIRLNLSVRSCDDEDCSGDSWNDIDDSSPQNMSISNNRYFQYNFSFETDNASYSPELYNVTIYYGNDTTPPESVSNLQNQSAGSTWIYWTWTNPSIDFYQAIVYLDGEWKTNTTNNYHNATGLTQNTTYMITVHTKDYSGNVNDTDVNNSATTLLSLDANFTYLNDGTNVTAYGYVGGTLSNVYHNVSIPAMKLTLGDSSGNYASEVFDTLSNSSWNNIFWITNAMGELQDNQQIETKFAAGNANMTQNVLLLHLNNDSVYGENSTYVYDFSGQGNNGTPIADAHPNSTNYKFGSGAFDFDGTGDYIKINDSPSLDINGSEFTFEAWIKPSGSPSNEDNFFIKGDRNDVINYYLSRKSSGSMTWAFKDPAWNYLDSTSDQPATGEWSYIALVFKRPNVTFYVNDNSWHYNNQATGGSMDKDLPSNNYDLWIGSGRNNGVPPSPGSASAPFDGTMDEVAIYNRSLSPDEILEHYERGVIRLNLSVRSCDDEDCSGDSWNDIDDSSPQNLSISNNRYFQYNFSFETDNASYSPELYNVTIYFWKDTTPSISIINLTSTNPSRNDTNQNLTVSVSTSDPDNDTVKVIYNWLRNDTSIMTLNLPFEGGSTSGSPGNNGSTKDYSGFGNNGIVVNASWNNISGFDGKGAYEFNGTDYIDMGDNFEIDKGTILFWVSPAENISLGWSKIQSPWSKDENFSSGWDNINGTYQVYFGGMASSGSTSWFSPTDDDEIDNHWSNPNRAYTSNNDRTREATNGDMNDWFDFNFDLPPDSTVTGIEVKIEAQTWDDEMCGADVELSWDFGNSYTSTGYGYQTDSGTDQFFTLGGSTDNWGRVWTEDEFSNNNFLIRFNKTGEDGTIHAVDHMEIRLYIQDSDTKVQSSVTNNWTANQWYHIGISWNETVKKLFVDGLQESYGFINSTASDSNNPFFIGKSYASDTFNGTIDEFMIFNRTLSSNQILALYNNQTDIIVSQELAAGDVWKTEATPNDGYSDGISVMSNSITINAADTEPPNITIIGPINNSGDPDGEVSFRYVVNDDLDVVECKHYINGDENESSQSITKNTTLQFKPSDMPVGHYNWSITCKDEYDNLGTSGVYELDVIMLTDFGGSSTDITIVDIRNIDNFTIENPGFGKIVYNEPINLTGGMNINSLVGISQNLITVDSASEPRLNKSADIYLNNLQFSQKPQLLKDGEICSQSICTFLSYDSNITFNVTGFTSYSATENSQSEIWDSTDPKGGGAILYTYDQFNFTANYTNRTSGSPISGAEVYCEITFDAGGWSSPVNMTYNSSTELYSYNRSFETAGLLDWNVTCDGSIQSYEPITVTDQVAVRPTDFFIHRGFATIPTGANSVTIYAGTDYTAPDDLHHGFMRIVSTRLSGTGSDISGGTQDPDEFMASIDNPENLLTSITFTRYSSTATYNTRIYWELIEYQGVEGGKNEIIVRDQAEITQSSGVSINGSTVAGISDDNDVVVFITGQRHDGGADSTTADRGLYTSEWFSTEDIPGFTRGDGTGTSAVSYAVVEFTGQNWKIQRTEHPYIASGAWETENINAVNDLSRAALHVQMRTASGTLDEQGQEVYLFADDTIRFQLESGAGIFSQVAAVWVIENTQTALPRMNVERVANTRVSGGGEPDEWSESVTPVTRHFSSSIMGESARSSGPGTAIPRGAIGLELSVADNVDLWRSDTGQTQAYRFEVVEWPIETFNFVPTDPTGILCDNSSNCSRYVSQSLDVMAIGSYDVEGDNITYIIDASIDNTSHSSDLESSTIQHQALAQMTTQIYYDDFSADSGEWIYSGTCTRQTGDAACRDGNACIRCLGTGSTGEDGTAIDTSDLASYDECQIDFYRKLNSHEAGECSYHRYYDTSYHDILQVCDPDDDNIWYQEKYNYSSLGYTLETESEVKFSTEASGGADYWYIDNVNLTCFNDPYVESNSNFTEYLNVLPGDFKNLSTLSVTIYVSAYDNSGSSSASNNNPDFELFMYNGTGYTSAGVFSISGTGNKTLVVSDPFIESAWLIEENHDLRIRAVNLDYYDSSNIDEVNYSGVWVSIAGHVWHYIGSHENNTLVWNTTTIPEQMCVDLRARAIDFDGSNSSSGYFEKDACLNIDYTPPNITGVDNQSITDSTAVIVWNTDELANSTVFYGNTSAIIHHQTSSAMVLSHSVPLTGLNGSTLYYFNVTSCDFAGNCMTSGLHNFTTSDVPDTTPPNITNVTVSDITEHTATINWTTDENANSTVIYGPTMSMINTKTSVFLVTDHSIIIDGLQPMTFYYFNVSSCDLAGYCSEAGAFNFTTPDLSDPVIVSLDHPENGAFVNLLVIDLNFTAYDNVEIENCTLYGDFNGTWQKNMTITNITNNTETNFSLNLPTGTYEWNILCYDTYGNSGWHFENFTFSQEDRVMFISETVDPIGTWPNTSVNVFGHINLSDGTDVINNPMNIFVNSTSIHNLLISGFSADWWNLSWYYRTQINVTEKNDTILSDYAANINLNTLTLIEDNKMKSDCSDIRILNSTALVDFWIEEGCNTTQTSIWIEMDLAANSTSSIYVYYGNSAAISLSNGSSVFFFYDDFEDGNIDGWQNYSAGGVRYTNYSGNGVIHKIGSDDPNGGYGAFASNITGFETRFMSNKINFAGGTQDRYAISGSGFDGYGPRVTGWDGSATFAIEERSGGASTGDLTSTTVTLDSVTWYEWRFRYYDGNLESEILDTSGTELHSISTTDFTVNTFDRFVIHGGREFYTDDIIVRPYVPNEPSFSVGTEESVLMTDSNGDYNFTFNASFPDGYYHVRVNSTYNVIIKKEVYEDLYIDSIFPNVSIDSIVPDPAERIVDNVTVNWTATDRFLSTHYAMVEYPNGTLLDYYFADFEIDAINLTVPGDYNVTVYAIDMGFNVNTTWQTFTVQDTILPNITNVRNESITNESAIILWDTDERANSTVRWGNTTALLNTSYSMDFGVIHSIPLINLRPFTTYYYNVTSCDPYGNCRTVGGFNFTTTGEGDTSPPNITNVSVSDITETSSRINWTTDENANSTIEYGVNLSMLNLKIDATLLIDHNLVISGLSPNTLYYFNVSSCDLSGNCAESGIYNFTTIDITLPNVTALLNPANDALLNYSIIEFNFTANDNDLIANCSLWTDFSGVFERNLTIYNTTNDVETNITLYFGEGIFKWNIECVDQVNNSGFYFENYTINIDTLAPTAFNLTAPLNQTNSTDYTPLLDWTQTIEQNFVNYTIHVDNDSDFTSIEYTYVVPSIGVTEYLVTSDWNVNVTYYWRVTAYDIWDRTYTTHVFTYFTEPVTLNISLNLDPQYLNQPGSINASGMVSLTDGTLLPSNPVYIYVNGTQLFRPGDGTDGNLVVSSADYVVNDYAYLTDNLVTAGSTSINVSSTTDFSDNDEIILIQMQHSSGVGVYQFIKGIDVIDANQINFTTPTQTNYYSGDFDQEDASVAMIVRVPQYTNVTVRDGASITAPAWDGYTGGLVMFKVKDSLKFEGSGHINVSGLGYRGGGCGACGDGDWGQNGEGATGLGSGGGPIQPDNYPDPDSTGGVGGYGPSGAGGEPGGGGSYGTRGLNSTSSHGNDVAGGYLGGDQELTQILFGGGGGGGGDDDSTSPQAIGGAGAGSVIIFSKTIVNATVYSIGEDGVTDGGIGGETGGGAGGAIWLSAENISVIQVNASGGSGQVDGADISGDGGYGRIRMDSIFRSGQSEPLEGYNGTPYSMLTNEYAQYSHIFESFTVEGAYEVFVNSTYFSTIGTVSDYYYLDFTNPKVSSLLPLAGTEFNISQPANISVNVTDNFLVQTVYANISWSEGSALQQLLDIEDDNIYWSEFFNTADIGNYNITIIATDFAGNVNDSETTFFVVVDSIPPDVTNITPKVNTYFDINVSVEITANVTDNIGVHTVLANISWFNGSTILQLLDSDNDSIYNATYINTSIGGRYNITIIANDTSSNINNTETSWFIVEDHSYHFFYGNASGSINLGLANSVIAAYPTTNILNVISTDIDSNVDFFNLQAIGRGKDNTTSLNDFSDIDTVLGLTYKTDSVETLWGMNSSAPKETLNLTVFGTVINNVPVVNSTENNTIFKTGFLWDISDSVDNEFDTSEQEDLIMITVYNESQNGTYGTYGYELRIPETLDTYKGATSLVVFYIELK